VVLRRFGRRAEPLVALRTSQLLVSLRSILSLGVIHSDSSEVSPLFFDISFPRHIVIGSRLWSREKLLLLFLLFVLVVMREFIQDMS
jgi:hypothetical protein